MLHIVPMDHIGLSSIKSNKSKLASISQSSTGLWPPLSLLRYPKLWLDFGLLQACLDFKKLRLDFGLLQACFDFLSFDWTLASFKLAYISQASTALWPPSSLLRFPKLRLDFSLLQACFDFSSFEWTLVSFKLALISQRFDWALAIFMLALIHKARASLMQACTRQ